VTAASALLRGRRRAAPLALGFGALAVAVVAAAGLLGGGGDGKRRASATGGSTATVTRRTLVSRETVDGTLGYAGTRTVINRLASSDGSSPSGGPTAGDGSDATDGSIASADAAVATTAVAAFQADDPQDGQQPEEDGPEGDDDQPQGEQPDREEGQPDEDQPEGDGPQGDEPQGDQPQGDQPQSDQPQDDQPSADSASPRSGADSPAGGDGSDPSAYSGSGTLTAMASAGSVVKRGGALYRLDGDPIVLMYGSTPAYRALRTGVPDGRDVRQLEQNLAALGFDPGTVDDSFDSATAAAVADWQESAGLERTGIVELGRVVFLPGPRRVGEHKASVGGVLGAGSEVLDTSSTKRVVTVELDASLQSLARDGARVEVTLPDGSPVGGRITAVGRVAREVDSGSGDPNAEQQLVIDVTIELRSKRGIGRLDEAPVGVGLAQETRRDVLAVPVNALVARRGGGYGIELAASHRIVPVEAGLFADGDVEISGRGISEGTRVVVPRE
jgi:hypothetical protein